jgi:hypothetical protein
MRTIESVVKHISENQVGIQKSIFQELVDCSDPTDGYVLFVDEKFIPEGTTEPVVALITDMSPVILGGCILAQLINLEVENVTSLDEMDDMMGYVQGAFTMIHPTEMQVVPEKKAIAYYGLLDASKIDLTEVVSTSPDDPEEPSVH